MLYNIVKKELLKNKELRETGKYTGIPMPFKRLSAYIPLCAERGQSVGVLAATGAGKCLARDTKVLMFNGEFKNVQDVMKNDLLMGVDSTPRKVLNTCKGVDQLYKITQNKGLTYKVNSQHILSLMKTRKGEKEIKNIKVSDSLLQNKNFLHNYKGYKSEGIDFKEKEILLDPYILGIWLGDGDSRDPCITSFDKEIIEELYKYADKNNLKINNNTNGKFSFSANREYVFTKNDSTIKVFTSLENAAYFYNIKKYLFEPRVKKRLYKNHKLSYVVNNKENIFSKHLISYNLFNNKHIPIDYLINTKEVRLNLLAGLIDSDGHNDKNKCFSIVQKNKNLAENIVYLSRGLGFYTSIKKVFKKCKNCKDSEKLHEVYNITISGNLSSIPTKVQRKKCFFKEKNWSHLTTGIKVQKAEIGEYYGFELDGDNLFMLDDLTITHNSRFTRFLYIYHCYKFYKQFNYPLRIIYFPLEDNKEKVMRNMICHYLHEIYNIYITLQELNSVGERILPEFVVEKINEAEDFFKEFEQIITIIDGLNEPTQIFNYLQDYALKTGRVENYIVDGQKQSRYVANNNVHTIVVIDNMSNIDQEEGQKDERHAMLHFCKTLVRGRLCNFFKFTVVQVLQQDFASERQSFTKDGETLISKLEPSLAGVGNSKEITRSMHLVIGMFHPARFNIVTYPAITKYNPKGYQLDVLGNRFRSLHILKANDVDFGQKIPILFDAVTENMSELPELGSQELEDIYRNIREKNPTKFSKIVKTKYEIEEGELDELPF